MIETKLEIFYIDSEHASKSSSTYITSHPTLDYIYTYHNIEREWVHFMACLRHVHNINISGIFIIIWSSPERDDVDVYHFSLV